MPLASTSCSVVADQTAPLKVRYAGTVSPGTVISFKATAGAGGGGGAAMPVKSSVVLSVAPLTLTRSARGGAGATTAMVPRYDESAAVYVNTLTVASV